MCDQTEILYKNGDVVWVKLGNVFWPGQVVDLDSIDDDISNSFKKKPIAAVQFFGEDKYEFVKSLDHISLYNGRRKNDFLKKGIEQFRKQKDGVTFMNKFPDDVKRAEELTGGNPHILDEPEFLPQEKQSYRALFDGNKSVETKKGGKRGRPPATPKANGRRSVAPTLAAKTPLRPITHPRFVRGETDHDVRIRQQGLDESPSKDEPGPKDMPYKCTQCDFTASRLNVIVLHNKFHSDATSAAKPKAKGRKPGRPRATVAAPAPAPAPAPTPPEPTRGSKRAVKRKIWADEETTPTPVRKAGRPAKKPVSVTPKNKGKAAEKAVETPEKKVASPEKKVASPEKKIASPVKPVKSVGAEKASPGKRKAQAAEEASAKKSREDGAIRDTLLADWDDEDAEQERQELEQLLKKAEPVPAEPAAAAEPSCFDFDDDKDALLGTELEKRAKKFVESRKAPRAERMDAELREAEPNGAEQLGAEPNGVEQFEAEPNGAEQLDAEQGDAEQISAEQISAEQISAEQISAEQCDVDALLAETEVPSLPSLPETRLPDVVLDSSPSVAATQGPGVTSMDHDYSARRGAGDAVPAVLTGAVGKRVDVVAAATGTVKVFRAAAPTSKVPPTVVRFTAKVPGKGDKAPLRTTVSPTKGLAGGKYIIVQSPTGQQSRLTIAPAEASGPGTSHKVQSVGGGKVVILTKPATAAQKAPTPALKTQRIVSATGQILTPVSGRTPIPPGTRITPITGSQMRLMSAGGVRHQAPKIQMQSLQTKVVLPSMAKMAPRKVVLPAARPLTPGLTARPRLLKTTTTPLVQTVARAAFTPKILQQPRASFQPRMLVQRPRAPLAAAGGVARGGVTRVGVAPAATTTGQVMKIIPQPKRTTTAPPTIQRVALTQPPRPAARQKTFTITTAPAPPPAPLPVVQEPPPLAPFSAPPPTIAVSDAGAGFTTEAANTVLTAEQLAQLTSTSTSALGDGATYVLLTIDEAGNLHPYNNQSLLGGFDGADPAAGGALYIDSGSLDAGGGLDSVILTLGGPQAQQVPVQSDGEWMPTASQDILAAALANTDVFQTETTMHDDPCMVDTSSLLASIPSTLLLPSLHRSVPAANVSETSLTLNQPIMSPLEVDSAFPPPPAAPAPEPAPAFHPSMPLLSEEPEAKGEEFVVEEAVGAGFDAGLANEMMPFLGEESAGLPQSMPLLCDDAAPEPSQDSQASAISEPAFE